MAFGGLGGEAVGDDDGEIGGDETRRGGDGGEFCAGFPVKRAAEIGAEQVGTAIDGGGG